MEYLWCVLEHTVNGTTHLDFLFEPPETRKATSDEPKLWTWAFPESPWDPHHRTGLATRLPDHRRIYLEYEGEIAPSPTDPEQRSRGTVRRLAKGTFVPLQVGPEWTYQFRMSSWNAQQPLGTWDLTLRRLSCEWEYRMVPAGPETNSAEFENHS